MYPKKASEIEQIATDHAEIIAAPVALPIGENLKTAAPDIWTAFEKIKSYSPLGALTCNWLSGQNILFKQDIVNPTERARCDCSRKQVTVIIGPNHQGNVPFLLAHEIMHAVQYTEQSYMQNFEALALPLHIRIGGSFYAEAAANMFAARVLFEMKLNGCPEFFDMMTADDSPYSNYKGIFRIFEQTYNEAIDDGQPQNQALITASGPALDAWFTRLSMEIYAGQHCLHFLRIMFRDKINMPPPAYDSFLSSRFHTAAEIWRNQPLASDLKTPESFGDIFHGYNRLEDICDMIELERLKRAIGEDSPYYKAMRLEIDNSNNKFKDIDILDFYRELEKNDAQEESKDHRLILRIAHKCVREKQEQQDKRIQNILPAFLHSPFSAPYKR